MAGGLSGPAIVSNGNPDRTGLRRRTLTAYAGAVQPRTPLQTGQMLSSLTNDLALPSQPLFQLTDVRIHLPKLVILLAQRLFQVPDRRRPNNAVLTTTYEGRITTRTRFIGRKRARYHRDRSGNPGIRMSCSLLFRSFSRMDGPFRESCQPLRANSGLRVYCGRLIPLTKVPQDAVPAAGRRIPGGIRAGGAARRHGRCRKVRIREVRGCARRSCGGVRAQDPAASGASLDDVVIRCGRQPHADAGEAVVACAPAMKGPYAETCGDGHVDGRMSGPSLRVRDILGNTTVSPAGGQSLLPSAARRISVSAAMSFMF